MTKDNRTAKLYGSLDNKQKAALSIHYVAQGMDGELEQVKGTVKKFDYKAIDYEYRNWCDCIYHAISAWADLVLREKLSLCTELLTMYKQGDQVASKEVVIIISRLKSLQQIMYELSKEYGFSYADAEKLASVTIDNLPEGTEPDSEYKNFIIETLKEDFPGE